MIAEPRRSGEPELSETLLLWEKLWGVIVSPKSAFKAIGEDPRILVPALLVFAVNVLLAWLIIPETLAFTESALESTGQTMSPEALRSAMKWTKVSILVTAGLLPPIIWLIQAGVLALFNQLSVGEARFKQLFAVSFFAWLPPFLGGAIKSVLIKIVGIKTAMAIHTSLALFLPTSTDSGFWFVLLSKMDFFAIWGLALLSVGGAMVMNKEPRKTAVYVFGVWIVYLVIVAYFGVKYGNVPGM